MSNQFQKIKIVKLFASSEYKSRNKAYKVIVKLLKYEFGNEKRQLNEKDIISIWKGFFIWLWMQDKPILHEEVIGKICNLLPEISCDKVALEFINAFFITMIREWKKLMFTEWINSICQLGIFFASVLIYLQPKDTITDEFLTFFSSSVFDGVVNHGVEFKLHLIDILLDEMVKAMCSQKLTTGILVACIRSMSLMGQKHFYVIKLKKSIYWWKEF